MARARSSGASRHRLVLRVHGQTPSDDFGRLFEGASLPVDGHDQHHEPVPEVPSVTEHLVGDLARPRAIDEDAAGRNAIGHARPRAIEPEDIAVFCHELSCRDRPGQPCGVPSELPVLTMYRHEVRGLTSDRTS